MRVAVVSPETSYHRRIDVTHRLERLVVGLEAAGHDVTVLTTKWWSEGEQGGQGEGSQEAFVPNAQGAHQPESGGVEDSPAETPTEHSDDTAPSADDDVVPARDRSHPKEPADEREEVTATTDPDRREVDGVTYRALAASPQSYRRFLTGVPTALARARPDVIHAVASRPGTVVAARSGSSFARAPVIAEWYDATDTDKDEWTVKQAVRRASRTIVPSRLVRRQLRELGADDDALRVIPDGIRMDDIEATTPDDGAEIVYARRLDEAANLESLLLGLAELRNYGWSATVIGDGPARSEYEQQVRDLRIDDRVTFAGACSREERIARYRDSHVFVQTARRCPFPTELLWGLACGCVGLVEYHADSSAHELVEGRDRGFRTTTPQEMADAIREAGELDEQTVDDSFVTYDEPTVVDRYVSCYENAIDHYGLF